MDTPLGRSRLKGHGDEYLFSSVHDCLYVVEPWKAGNVELFQGRSTFSLQIVIRVVDQAVKLWRVLGDEG